MSYSQTWLEDPDRARGLLVVAKVLRVGVGEETRYFSTMGFSTADGVLFQPIISKDLEITEKINIDGTINISYGDLELSNDSGELDSLLDNSQYAWNNKSIQIYYGDPRWTVANIASISPTFELIFDGLITEALSRSRKTVNLILKDKNQKLNVPITESIIGTTTGTWVGGQTNQDNIRPLIFGEVHNISPILTDPSTYTYMFNNGEAESLIEIRDNGYPIYTLGGDTSGATVSLANGTFQLTRPPAGAITCSAQGVKTTYDVGTTSAIALSYRNTIPDIIRLIVTTYGKAGVSTLTSAEIDNSNFRDVLNSYPSTAAPACGYAVLERENLLEIIQKLAYSIDRQPYFTRKGLLQLLGLGSYTTDPMVTITDSDIILGSLSVVDKITLVGSFKLAYAKNWTVQENLATLIQEVARQNFASTWLLETRTDAATLSNYNFLAAEPKQKETLLITTSSAIFETERLLNYYKSTRIVYRFTGTSRLISLKLGQRVNITHNRFGLQSGKDAQVISLTPRWCKGLVDVEVIV